MSQNLCPRIPVKVVLDTRGPLAQFAVLAVMQLKTLRIPHCGHDAESERHVVDAGLP